MDRGSSTRRRSVRLMKRTFSTAVLVSALSVVAQAQRPIDYASPFVGTDGHGHAYPGATMPFGMVQLSPDTRLDTWDGCSGYHYSDKSILGFSHTHLSGTGIGSLGDIMVMPYVGDVSATTKVASSFSHDQESAKPGYYKVFLKDPKVTAELTATVRAGFHKYTFPASTKSYINLDLNHGIQNDIKEGYIKVESPTRISGYRRSEGWGGNRFVYFVMELSRPMEGFAVDQNGTMVQSPTEAKGKVRGFARFTTKAGEAISVRVGISPTSIEAASKNLATEIQTWDFDTVRKAGDKEWNTALSTATVETKDAKIKRTFYSNMYLSFQAPNTLNDVDGTYLGQDKKVHPKADFRYYSTFSLWDTYRALNPLVTFLQPQHVPSMVNSLLANYDQSGYKNTGVWTLWNQETWVMVGHHSVSMIGEAILKDQKGFDWERAYQAIKTTQMGDRDGLDTYKKNGYVASRPGMAATSKTIEFGYNDYCVARVAEKLGHKEDAEYFYKRAAQYRNVYDTTSKFFRGRKENGTWRAPFDTIGLVGDEYTESNAWQYLFAIQHDVPGMIELQGGKDGFVKRMDEMFTMDPTIHTNIPDITGQIGQYAHGNEPCHHVAYLYAYAGAPYKTQMRVREVMDRFYDDTPGGQIGNVDCGQTSAWYVFSALGFYPVNPASGEY
ncbi:glycoside hydrolase family 92 protein, partial [bacterium]